MMKKVNSEEFRVKNYMKRFIFLSIFFGWLSLSLQAQDFMLFFANNITDVLNFDDIESTASGLEWREVKDRDLAGNVVEVDEIKKMFASKDIKYRAQQRQFWRMRDHCLLCFRIDDGTNGANSYQVEVEDTIGRPKSITVSRFFFLNVMRQENPISIKVWKIGDEQNAISFKYYVADWDDDQLYTFQLDSKRQLEYEEYSLEYKIGYADSLGEWKNEVHTLALRDSSFQSFYVGKDQTLVDVFLKSGNHKLRLNKARLHPGVTLDPDFERTVLTTRFLLDKHENRELVNFNWIGSGLYERYDTLYLSIHNEAGKNITKATIHVDPVDEYGVSTGVEGVKYLKYDSKKKAHLILTYGNPAYIEVIANGYCPAVYKFAGAADREGIVDLERCEDNMVLFNLPNDNDEIAISSQHLYVLNNTNTIQVLKGKDYSICDLVDYDLSTCVKADTITYMEDAGNTWLKTLNGEPIERYAQIELAYSSTVNQYDHNNALIATNVDTGDEYTVKYPTITSIRASQHPGFTYDHFFTRFNLIGSIPLNTMVELRLESNGKVFDRIPYLRNLHIEREKIKKAGQDMSDSMMNPGEDAAKNTYAEEGMSFNFPVSFKMHLGPLFKIKNTVNYDMKKQKLTSTTTLTYKRQDGDDEFENEMRKEAQEFIDNSKDSGHTWYGDGDVKYSNVGDTRKFENWFAQEMDDICSIDYNNIGTGFFGSGKFKFSVNLGKLMSTGSPSQSMWIEEISGTLGYGVCLGSPSLLDKYLSEGAIASILKKIPLFGIGGVFEASVQGDLGFKTFNTDYPSSWDNFGFFFNLSAKIRAGLWAELCIPSNPIFAGSAGLRGGGKIGAMWGCATPFQSDRFTNGFYIMAGVGVEAYANIRTFGFQWAGRAGLYLATQKYKPDNGHNPFHKDFPYWLTAINSKAQTVAESYKRVPSLNMGYFGNTLVSDVASDANPHFIDEDHVVYNDLGDPADYNDDCVRLLNLKDGSKESLTSETFASRHMRSKRGEHEVVVYEQLTRKINPDEMVAEHAMSKSNELSASTRIMSSFKQSDGTWKQFRVSYDDGMVDTKPVTTIQEDGKAACIWQHGVIKAIDETISTDSMYNNALDGQLVLSIFDGEQWCDPITLHNINKDLAASEYDLIMRNDTVLVGTNLVSYPTDTLHRSSRFVYSSVDVARKRLFQKEESLKPVHFFMNRVGHHGVIALLYEKNDSIRDIYVKTLSMNGYADGLMGSDIGAHYCSPNRVKIICDRAAENLNDFAILWTEVSNNAHYEDGEESYTEEPRNMLNASRISLLPSPFVTVPLTMGTEHDNLLITDFDGVLDDSHIKVVYSLSNLETGGSVIMTSEKYFTNSFTYDVGYSRLSLLGSSTLPISVVVSNTGTSSIRSVTATINGQDFEIENSYVAPMQKRTFIVNYPITPDFDGYITNSVSVVYNNVFKAKQHPRRSKMSMLRQVKSAATPAHVDLENVELTLVRHSVENNTNYFLVELIDHSLYGLKSHNAIHVGLYPHPSVLEPIMDEAETTVTAADFEDYGGVRKAYATVKISGVNTSASAYLTTHLFDLNNTADIERSHVDNYNGSSNAYAVSLMPYSDPTAIRQLRDEQGNISHRIRWEKTNDGVRISGLDKGNYLRLFTSTGMVVYRGKVDAKSVFIPLKHHDTYLISTGKEVVKFAY